MPTARARPTGCSGRALAGLPREDYCLVGAVGHDFYEGERDGPRGFPRFTDPAPARPRSRVRRLPADGRPSAASSGSGPPRFDLLLLHNPDRTGYSSEAVWDGMAALREAGLAARIGVAPGPANGFTLDLIACLERFGERIDWAMIILNPLEPWPGELCLDAAARARGQGDHPRGRLRRPLLGRPAARDGARRRTITAPFAPPAGSRRGCEKLELHAADRRARRPHARSSSPASGTSPTRPSSASRRP